MEAAEERDLSRVRQRVRHRALEEPVFLALQRSGGEPGVEPLQGGVEPDNLFRPGERGRVVPLVDAIGEAKGPVHQVAHVGQNLGGSANAVASPEPAEILACAFQRAVQTVGEGGESVTQHGCYFNVLTSPDKREASGLVCPAYLLPGLVR